ncbi:MAG: MXAN_5187 C-terminal domain-containing protein [Thermodesulfobacteriota bacterium]
MDDVKIMLDRMEGDIAVLKQQYDLFFQGTRRGEPTRERKEFEGRILALSRRSIVNVTDQHRFNNLQGKYWSFANLWTRMIRDLEEGRLRRDEAGAVTRLGIDRPLEERQRGERAPEAAPFDAEQIDRVARELADARRSCGIAGEGSEVDSLKATLQAKAKELSASSGGKTVAFRVSVEDGKPKVKATIS